MILFLQTRYCINANVQTEPENQKRYFSYFCLLPSAAGAMQCPCCNRTIVCPLGAECLDLTLLQVGGHHLLHLRPGAAGLLRVAGHRGRGGGAQHGHQPRHRVQETLQLHRRLVSPHQTHLSSR